MFFSRHGCLLRLRHISFQWAMKCRAYAVCYPFGYKEEYSWNACFLVRNCRPDEVSGFCLIICVACDLYRVIGFTENEFLHFGPELAVSNSVKKKDVYKEAWIKHWCKCPVSYGKGCSSSRWVNVDICLKLLLWMKIDLCSWAQVHGMEKKGFFE